VPRRVIVLGPNHSGSGGAVAVAPHRSWSTPIGPQPIDLELAERLIAAFPAARRDDRAHVREHSIEVQLPFLRRRRPDVVVLPICLAHLGIDDSLALGRAIAELVTELDEPVGIVASSDMSHYQPDDEARRLDHMAIEPILARDPETLYDTVHRHHITMCGVVPATVALTAGNALGATDAHLVAYATSGDVNGNYDQVVGYAGVCVHA
jgi:AmmeMemoRadiSam system protein B